jgi:ABC-2 type transport system permease protein
MKIQRIKAIIVKEFRGLLKEPAGLFLIIIFPIIMTLAFGFSFGQIGSNGDPVYSVTVINGDIEGNFPEWSEHFILNLSKNEVLEIHVSDDLETAENDLLEGKISALIYIPIKFGDAIQSYWQDPLDSSQWENVTVDIFYDSGSVIASQLLPPLFQQALLDTLFGQDTPELNLPIQLGAELVETDKKTTFDYFVPGLFAFASIFLTMTIAQGITDEKEKGILKRIYLTPVKSEEIMIGITIANVITALTQTALVLLMAFLIGYRPEGGIIFAFLLISVFSLSCIGFGLIAGAISKNSGMATGISFMFIIPQMFLGTFVSLGSSTIINKMVPSYYVTDALTSLFLRGAPATSGAILLDLGILMIYSIVVFIIGIFAFNKISKKL